MDSDELTIQGHDNKEEKGTGEHRRLDKKVQESPEKF